MSGVGALSAPQYQTIPADQTADQGANQLGPLAPTVNRAGGAYAIGDLADNFKKAQLQDITQATQLSAASRQRLNQIWEAGTANPQLQQDPKVHQTIAQLYKHMGLASPPVDAQGKIDWNALAPVRNLAELPPATLTALNQMQPKQRQIFVKSNHIVGADDAWLNAPAEPTPQMKVEFQKDYAHIVQGGGYKGMTPSAFRDWVDRNRNVMDQTLGEGMADATLNDPAIFSDMQSQAQQALTKQQSTIAEIRAKTKSYLGLTPDKIAQIKKDNALASQATAMTDLDGIRSKYVGAQLKDLPAMDQAKINQLNQQANQLNASAEHMRELVTDLKTKGGPAAATMKTVHDALTAADSQYKTAAAAYMSAVNSGLGVPPEVEQAYSDAKTRLDTVQGAYDDLSSPATQAAIKANAFKRNTGVPANPTDTSGKTPVPAGTPAGGTLKGKPIFVQGNKWVFQDGSPAQ